MKKYFFIAFACFINTSAFTQNSAAVINPVNFFQNDSAFDVKLTMDVGKLLKTSLKPEYIPSTFTCVVRDTIISEGIRIIARGKVRREICYMPPVKLNFHNPTSPRLYSLNSLKLVWPCSQNNTSDQLVIKEYLVYKIYNLLTDKSFRVRLLNLTCEDEKGKKKTYSSHGFFIEDIKAVAKRNECKELKNVKTQSETTDRDQMTIVAMFQYMIGNTDWGVSVNHNTVLIQPKKDSLSRPYVVPYDFDYAGLVNASYAVPNEGLEIEDVRQRLYRGFPRTLEELNEAIGLFSKQKDKIYSLVNTCEPLSEFNKKEMTKYFDAFYKIIENKKQVKYIFVDQARFY
jgi:hypothetical protein